MQLPTAGNPSCSAFEMEAAGINRLRRFGACFGFVRRVAKQERCSDAAQAIQGQ
jgi:hypothetical protein